MRVKSFFPMSIALFAVLATGARDHGCLGPRESDRSAPPADETDAGLTSCPALACRLACPNGFASDADGCSLCECADEPAALSCWSDADCGSGRCDVVNFCDPPPGCDPGEACPPVCYGRCVSSPSSEAALCEASNGRWMPTSCGHWACGQAPACDAIVPGCDCGPTANFVAGRGCVASGACEPGCQSDDDCDASHRCAIENDCDPMTNDCAPQTAGVCVPRYAGCLSDAECPPNEHCLPTPGAPCRDDDPTCVPMVGQCVPSSLCQPVDCDQWCEHGYELDAAGCETCACNEPPDECLCTEEYAPVCGDDGTTYSNHCQATCANVRVVSTGECGPDCNIQCLVPDPVCGTDGVTYVCGAFEAACHGVEVAHPGECQGCLSGADCPWGQKCLTAADGASRCVPVTFCQSPEECAELPKPDPSASWHCEANACTAR